LKVKSGGSEQSLRAARLRDEESKRRKDEKPESAKADKDSAMHRRGQTKGRKE